jgi:hypothetical protein
MTQGIDANDCALATSGATVVLATSHDEHHPAESVIKPEAASYWSTTGCYPQQLAVQLPEPTEAQFIEVISLNGAQPLHGQLLAGIKEQWFNHQQVTKARIRPAGHVTSRPRVLLSCLAVKAMRVLVSSSDTRDDIHFKEVAAVEHKRSSGVQRHKLHVSGRLRYVKLIIEEGHEPFCAVNKCLSHSTLWQEHAMQLRLSLKITVAYCRQLHDCTFIRNSEHNICMQGDCW